MTEKEKSVFFQVDLQFLKDGITELCRGAEILHKTAVKHRNEAKTVEARALYESLMIHTRHVVQTVSRALSSTDASYHYAIQTFNSYWDSYEKKFAESAKAGDG